MVTFVSWSGSGSAETVPGTGLAPAVGTAACCARTREPLGADADSVGGCSPVAKTTAAERGTRAIPVRVGGMTGPGTSPRALGASHPEQRQRVRVTVEVPARASREGGASRASASVGPPREVDLQHGSIAQPPRSRSTSAGTLTA